MLLGLQCAWMMRDLLLAPHWLKLPRVRKVDWHRPPPAGNHRSGSQLIALSVLDIAGASVYRSARAAALCSPVQSAAASPPTAAQLKVCAPCTAKVQLAWPTHTPLTMPRAVPLLHP